MYFKNIWAELSYGFGPSCLINLGRVGRGRVLCGPSRHGPSWFWAELSVIPDSQHIENVNFLFLCSFDTYFLILSLDIKLKK